MKSMTNGGFGTARPAPAASPRRGKAVRVVAAAVLYGAALTISGVAYAAPGGGGGGGHMGGGFGGGMHMGGGGFHGGGLSGGFHAGAAGAVHTGGLGGGFHTGAVGTLEGVHVQPHETAGFGSSGMRPDIAGGAEAGRLHAGSSQPEAGNSIVMRGNERGVQWHHGWHNGRFGWWQGYDPYLWSYGDAYGLDGTDEAQSGYYCSDPAGYYPAVTQCNSAWQVVSGN